MRFDHIGLIVPAMDDGRQLMSKLFLIAKWTREFDDPVNGVIVQFGRDSSGICYELIVPSGPSSPVARSLATGRNILNHVAYLVPRLDQAAAHAQACGCMAATTPKPAVAYGGALIQFFMTPSRFVLELIEAASHQHQFSETIGNP